ncbi:hypothetical protein E4U13_001402, partial [Claviceps humidiphila]
MLSSNSNGKFWSEGRLREEHLADTKAAVCFVFLQFGGLFNVTDEDLLCVPRLRVGVGLILGDRDSEEEAFSW